MDSVELCSARVLLRQWHPTDAEPFAQLNADAETMRYLPSTLTREQSDAFIARVSAKITERGWGLWALDIKGQCAGFVGLSAPLFVSHFTPCIEIGWRLARKFWGCGYATEAARLCLRHAFDTLEADEIVSFTTLANHPSQRVMERLGMSRNPADNFDHPALPAGHPQRPHLLYRLTRAAWTMRRDK